MPTTRTGSGFCSMPGRVLPGLGPKMVSKSMASISPSIISTFGVREKFMRNWAASTRSSSMAISRRTRRASREVSAPCPGPISRTVHCETSPSASTIRMAAASSIRKCCPSLGLWLRRGEAETFGTLPSFFPAFRLEPSSRDCLAQGKCVRLARPYDSLRQRKRDCALLA